MILAKSIEGLLLSILTRLDCDMTMIYGILLFEGREERLVKVKNLIKETMIQLHRIIVFIVMSLRLSNLCF